ncbi:MAG: thioredoxin [Ahrensia sp.]|nr:thioredoxin [Ahrensia sp.]
MGAGPASAPATAHERGGDKVFDVSSQNFMSEVLEASKSVPVIVDFWAPWCGPCKQLGPIIEKVVNEAAGAVRLAKMDIDQHPDIAGQMGIQSIPAVVAFIDGRPADAFMGAKPEAQIRAFVEKVMKAKPTAQAQTAADLLEQANALFGDGDFGGAAELFSQILSQDPGNLAALAVLGQCYVAVGEVDHARNLLESLPQEQRDDSAMAGLVKTLELKDAAEDLGDVEPLAAAVSDNPKDHQARFDYALALNARGMREEAADQLLEIVHADRKWKDDGARAQLLEFFEAWGNADEATVAGRRRLSSILFS